MKATKIFSIERIVELDSGVLCRLHMDLFDVSKGKAKGLFLDRFRFSWIFFEIENPMRRVLVDCHKPSGFTCTTMVAHKNRSKLKRWKMFASFLLMRLKNTLAKVWRYR